MSSRPLFDRGRHCAPSVIDQLTTRTPSTRYYFDLTYRAHSTNAVLRHQHRYRDWYSSSENRAVKSRVSRKSLHGFIASKLTHWFIQVSHQVVTRDADRCGRSFSFLPRFSEKTKACKSVELRIAALRSHTGWLCDKRRAVQPARKSTSYLNTVGQEDETAGRRAGGQESELLVEERVLNPCVRRPQDDYGLTADVPDRFAVSSQAILIDAWEEYQIR